MKPSPAVQYCRYHGNHTPQHTNTKIGTRCCRKHRIEGIIISSRLRLQSQ